MLKIIIFIWGIIVFFLIIVETSGQDHYKTKWAQDQDQEKVVLRNICDTVVLINTVLINV